MYLGGVAAEYLDYGGHHHFIDHHSRCRALEAMGYPVADEEALAALCFEFDAAPWQQWLRPQTILTGEEPLTASFHPEELHGSLHWRITFEDGTEREGEMCPASLPEVGNYVIGDVRYSGRDIRLEKIPPGYHAITITGGEKSCTGELVVCPPRCYTGERESDEHVRRWGVACQLYTLRSDRNWGVGDFLDLAELVDVAASHGADMIALNPLHATCCQDDNGVSPYSPSDRRYYNPIYLAPELIPYYSDEPLDEYSQLLTLLPSLRDAGHIDYHKVAELKYRAYAQLYRRFLEVEKTRPDYSEPFRRFIARQGAALTQFCNYEVSNNPFGGDESDNPEFFAWLQWQCVEQLEHCQNFALAAGMAIGLVGDIAVGAVSTGNEVLSNTSIYRLDASIGAPPDPFAAEGQNWNLPVMNPLAMRATGFAHFIQLLRANMRHYGAVRIDHVMSLMRLWWCLPAQHGAVQTGAYVYYPFKELMSLLKLESHRNHCQVIGEDLGVVPDEFRIEMNRSGLLGNTVFYFDKHHNNRFKHPWELREQVALMITNHDVPTLSDWWQCGDIERRQSLGIMSGDEANYQLHNVRSTEKHSLLELLQQQELLPATWQVDDLDRQFDLDLCAAIHRLCSRSVSRWVFLQLEDLQLMSEPVNIPGTHTEYKNWRRRQNLGVKEIFEAPGVHDLVSGIQQERAGSYGV